MAYFKGSMSSKEDTGATRSCFETYTRYSRVADEDQKKFLGVYSASFQSNLVAGGNNFFIFFKEGHLKKSLGNTEGCHMVRKSQEKLRKMTKVR